MAIDEKSLLISLFLKPWIMVGRHHSNGYLMSQCWGWLQLYKRWALFNINIIQLEIADMTSTFTLEFAYV